MEKINFRIQRENNLNEIFVEPIKQKRSNGTHHYEVKHGYSSTTILFQDGARNLPLSIPGVLDSDLLEIVRHRQQGFQTGEFACRENAMAITHIEIALMYLAKRANDRAERGVLGTNKK